MAVYLKNSEVKGWQIPYANLENHLATLPQRVQEVFRQKIREGSRQDYYFYKEIEKRDYTELGERRTITTYYMGPPNDMLFPDLTSPLYTKCQIGDEIEQIPVQPLNTVTERREPSFFEKTCKYLSELAAKILRYLLGSCLKIFTSRTA